MEKTKLQKFAKIIAIIVLIFELIPVPVWWPLGYMWSYHIGLLAIFGYIHNPEIAMANMGVNLLIVFSFSVLSIKYAKHINSENWKKRTISILLLATNILILIFFIALFLSISGITGAPPIFD